jgi:hypothetical protein
MSNNESNQLSQNIINLERNLNQTVVDKFRKALTQYDCVVLQLAQLNDDVLADMEGFENGEKPMAYLKASILYLKFGVSDIYGTIIGRLLSQNIDELNVNSVLVFNLSNSFEFIDKLRSLGRIFKEESIIVLEKEGGSNYRLGTGVSKNLQEGIKVPLLRFQDSIDEQFELTPVERRFNIETFQSLQASSKYIVSQWAKPLINLV